MEEEAARAAEIEHHEMRPFSGGQPQGSFMSTISSVSCTISYTKSAKLYLFVLIIITCIPLIFGFVFTILFLKQEKHNVNTNGAVVAFFTGKPYISYLINISLFMNKNSVNIRLV